MPWRETSVMEERLRFVAIETMIVTTKQNKSHWGARKIRELLVKKLSGDVRVPAKSTDHAILDRNGLVTRARRRSHHRAEGTALSQALRPNDLWCADQGRVQARQ